jgi:hypothetical protein
MELEEASILQRLAVDERPLKRLLRAIKSCTNVEQELQIYNINRMFLQAQKQRLESDLLILQKASANYNEEIQQSKQKQQLLKAQIQKDRDRYAYFQEYDRIASLILALPTSQESREQLSALQKSLFHLNEQNKQLDRLFSDTHQKLDEITNVLEQHLQQTD